MIQKNHHNWLENTHLNLDYLFILNQEKINGKLFLTGGISDEIIPIKFVKMLENHKNVTTRLYETGHMPNQQQFDDAYKFLLEEEKVYDEKIMKQLL